MPVTELDQWPIDRAVCLTLDFECDFGTALEDNYYEAVWRFPDLLSLLADYGVPLTCFLQTEVLEACPAADWIRDAPVPVEVHPHSHTHPKRARADVDYEVRESVTRVRDTFETDPLGYRFPDGDTASTDMATLAEHDVAFDSSLFPSWRPGRFDNADAPIYPYRTSPELPVELPLTVLSDRIRVPVSLSYLKLLGRPFEYAVYEIAPNVIVFDMHMHDLFPPETISELPPIYRAIYNRNRANGVAIFERFLRRFRRMGYSFHTMSELYEATAEALATSRDDYR